MRGKKTVQSLKLKSTRPQAADHGGGGRSVELHKAVRSAVTMNDADRRQDLDIDSVLKLYRSGGLPIGAADFPAE